MKDFLLCVHVVAETLNFSRCHLADYVKECYLSVWRTCSTIIFFHSTNQIIVFSRRCHYCCRRRPLQLQRKRHNKIELCVKLSLAIIPCSSRCTKYAKFTFAGLARMVFMWRQRMKELLLRARVVVGTSNMNISVSGQLAYVQTRLPQLAYAYWWIRLGRRIWSTS